MPNMGNSFVNFRHSSVSGVSSLFKMVDIACGLDQTERENQLERKVFLVKLTHRVDHEFKHFCAKSAPFAMILSIKRPFGW